jgi:formamidopyrimidine-DNA glycosylase
LKSPAANIKKNLEGAKLKKIYREGKELRFAFYNDAVVGMHLMVHGNLNLFNKKNEEKYAIFELIFDDDSALH